MIYWISNVHALHVLNLEECFLSFSLKFVGNIKVKIKNVEISKVLPLIFSVVS